jgi:hypothetical protein
MACKPWRERRIESHGVRGCFLALAIPFFGLPALLSSTVALFRLIRSGEIIWEAIIPATIFGGGLAVVVYYWRHWRKFGKSVCYLETLPGVIGGLFKASVEFKIPGRLPPTVLVKLENYKIAGIRPAIRLTAWETSKHVPPSQMKRLQGNKYLIQVRFEIPSGKDYYENWALSVTSELPGVNLSAYFNVPIFETAETHSSHAF